MFGAIVCLVRRNHNHTARQSFKINVVRDSWIGRAHFDGRLQRDQLLAELVRDVVDEAGNELAQWAAFDDAFKSSHDSDPHDPTIISN